MYQLSFLWEELPANPSPSPVSEEAWTTTVASWPSNFADLLNAHAPDGWSGRTSPASCQKTEDGILVPSSGRWSNSGMGSPIECSTLKTLEFHSGAVASSLSDILEIGDVPQRFYLSATACRGILRRAERRGKQLPTMLRRALEEVAGGSLGSATREGRTASSPTEGTTLPALT